MDINNLKKIKAIHQNAGDPVFRMAVSHLFDVGVRNLTEESVSETKQEINETTKENSFMTAGFQCGLLDIALELSTFSIWDILLYVKLYVGMDGDDMSDKEEAQDAVRLWASENSKWKEAIKVEDIFENVVDRLVYLHKQNFAREEVVEAFEYVLEHE